MRQWLSRQWTAWRLLATAACFLGAGAGVFARDKPNPALRTITKPHTNIVVGVAFSPDGKTLVSSSRDKTICFWDVATGKRTRVIRHTDKFGPLAYSPDGKTLAVLSDRDRVVILYDPQTGKEKARLPGFAKFLRSLAFSPDGKLLATKEDGAKEVALWDVAKGEKVRTLKGHTDVCDFHRQPFSPDGKRFVTGSADETVRVWEVASGKQVQVLKGHDGAVYCAVAFSPDGKTVVSGGERDKTVRLWDVETGKLKATLEGHSAGVRFVAFQPDGKTVLSLAVNNAEAKLWDVAAEKEKLAFKWWLPLYMWPPGYQSYLATSPDGKMLAVGVNRNEGTYLYLWDLKKVKKAK
jgi:WD40 repeat protein